MHSGLRRTSIALVLIVAGLARASDPPFPAAVVGLHEAPAAWLGPQGARVAIGPSGLVVAADGAQCWPMAPQDGPARLSPSSSPAWLAGGVDEYAAVGYADAKGVHVGAAGSRGPDWAGRPPLTALQFLSDEHGALAVGRLGDLKLRTEAVSFPQLPGVQITVVIQNRAQAPVQDVTYSREWRLADGRIARAQWSLGTLARRQSAALVLRYLPPGAPPPSDGAWAASALDLPVTLWVAPNHPFGLKVGATNGVSWGDFDADGFADLFACASGNLWRNVGGSNWSLAGNLAAPLPPATIRYGSSFGDWDADGLPDLILEPRKVLTGDTCWHLLHNADGSGAFEDVSSTALDVSACLSDGETACWADVDGDGRLDLFLPSYPSWVLNGAGNFLFRNLGPGPGPDFTEVSAAANADVPPPDSARPEGAQMCDVDFDGDVDLFSNGWLYQNDGAPGTPHFTTLPTASSGIGYPKVMDEGLSFLDYDLDGDFDLLVAYADAAFGLKLFENRGDGTFFEAESSIIDAPMIGLGLGLSAEDWDGDGDIDVSTRQVFRPNKLLETGARKFAVGLTPIPIVFLTSATPAWADWDHDGDLDMALGNYLDTGSFWTNTSGQPGAPPASRTDVRVLALDEGPHDGTQTAYGATIELRVHGDVGSPVGGPLRRKRFPSSAAGYLNQNEYAQTFSLPLDTPPESAAGTVFDVVVDFPDAPGAFAPGSSTSGTLRRIDRHVNPALGGLQLSALVDREIRVYRSGRVVLEGRSYEPALAAPRDLSTSTGGLQLPTAAASTGALLPAPTPNRWVGMDVDTLQAFWPVHLRELILDGQLDVPANCSTPFNIVLWDVTSSAQPTLVPGSALTVTTAERNNRSFIPIDFTLQPGRRYRLIARVTKLRFTMVQPQPPGTALRVNGGLNFRNDLPCLGNVAALTPLNSTRAYMSVRWAEDDHTAWSELGGGLAGAAGLPKLSGTGDLAVGQSITLNLRSTAPFSPTWILLGASVANQPFKGGTMVPAPLLAVPGLVTDQQGALTLAAPMTVSVPSGATIILQAWMADASGPQGAVASNGVKAVAP